MGTGSKGCGTDRSGCPAQAATAGYGPNTGSHAKVNAVEAINTLFRAVLIVCKRCRIRNPGYISVTSRHELHRKDVRSFEAEWWVYILVLQVRGPIWMRYLVHCYTPTIFYQFGVTAGV
jgi:hypothetical protein